MRFHLSHTLHIFTAHVCLMANLMSSNLTLFLTIHLHAMHGYAATHMHITHVMLPFHSTTIIWLPHVLLHILIWLPFGQILTKFSDSWVSRKPRVSTLFHILIDLDEVRVLSQSIEFSAKHANIGTVF